MLERQVNIINKLIADIRYYRDKLDNVKPYETIYDTLKAQYRIALGKLELLLEYNGEENVAARAYEIVRSGEFIEKGAYIK